MEWLAPITGLIAAGITVPLLVLLYFLKLKRREVLITSTFLWQRAVQDLQVNAPFQRLRRNILLLLQLLALLVVLTALARPVLSLKMGPARRVVVLIDRSASMSATDVDGTRLELAKRQAKEVIRSLRSAGAFSLLGGSDQAMVIAFDRHARVMCNFTSDQRQLLRAVDAIEPTDGDSFLAEAVTVARAYAQPPEAEIDGRTAEAAAQLELFSDGRIHDLGQVVVNSGELNFHCVGKSADNVAVVAMQARRSYHAADEVSVFASLANNGDARAECGVQLSVDGNVRAVRTVRIPARTPAANGSPAKPGKASVSFVLKHGGGGVAEVRQLRPDVLACDDAAWAILQPPKKLSVLAVTRGNLALTTALKACPLARLDIRTPAEFDAMDLSALGVERRYDVIVLDNHVPASKPGSRGSELPRGRYLIFGRPPEGIGVTVAKELKEQMVVDWRARHPVLQHVNMTNVFAMACYKMVLPRDATVLSEFGDAPAMAIIQRRGSVFLLVGFDVNRSNWPFEPGFVMFCYNAMNFLGLEVAEREQTSLEVGQAITVQAKPTEKLAELSGPGAASAKLACDASGTFRYPGTLHAGVYSLSIPGGREARFAVNVLDKEESNVEPVREIVLAGQKVAAQRAAPLRTNREVWPLLAALALVLVCVEWFVYNSRVKL